jgi:hypothetical protein
MSNNYLATTALTQLPALRFEPDRIIIGVFYQYIDNRGGWILHESKAPAPKDHNILGLGTRRAVQRFVDGRPEVVAEIPGGPELPDIDDLNAQIPREEWSIGLTGQPEAPWKKEFVFYGLDITDLRVITYSNSTIGATRAVTDLEERWEWARALYGADVRPVVRLGEGPFPTAFGERKRPIFEISGWRVFRDGALCVVDQNATALAIPQTKPASEVLRDSNPY